MPDQGDRQHGRERLGDLWNSKNNAGWLAAIVGSVADPGATANSSVADQGTASTGPTQRDTTPSALAQEIVFIDGAVPGAQLLAAGVKAGVQAVILDPGQDGVDQIAAYLADHDAQNLAAIAIVSHGADGVLFLGSSVL
ncbi:MAG: hypothetical protein QOH05_1423, partial [Acetobacteraceae bacterium]|nr:hypothetical protein [Acetobacteraceae bacterium]